MGKSSDAQAEKEAERERFFEQLSPEQDAPLREALLDVLNENAGSLRLNKVAMDPRVKDAKNALFPKGGAVTMSMWIQRCMPDELVVQPDPVARDNQVVSFLDAAPHPPTAAGKGGGIKRERESAPPRKGDSGKTQQNGKGSLRQTPFGKAAIKGPVGSNVGGVFSAFRSQGMPPLSNGNGKGKGPHPPPNLPLSKGKSKGKGATALREEPMPVEKGGAKGEALALERDAFFDSLPPAGFLDEEADLLQALLEELETVGGSARLNNVVSSPAVRQAKIVFLPKIIGITHWIERRVGNHLALEPDPVAKDNQIVTLVQVEPEPHVERGDRSDRGDRLAAERDAFFEGLPADSFLEEETMLVDALLSELESAGGRARLNNVVSVASVRDAKQRFLPKGVGITHWIERRVGTVLLLEPDPSAKDNQIVSIIPEEAQAPPDVGSSHEARTSGRASFFEGLPPNELSEQEQFLADALCAKLTSMGGSARLTRVVEDPDVKQGKMFLPKGVGIAAWITQRFGGELIVEPDPTAHNNQLVSFVGQGGDERAAKRRKT